MTTPATVRPASFEADTVNLSADWAIRTMPFSSTSVTRRDSRLLGQ